MLVVVDKNFYDKIFRGIELAKCFQYLVGYYAVYTLYQIYDQNK